MLSLRFKSKRRECRGTHPSRVVPARYLGAQRKPPATYSEDQSVTGPPSDAAISAPQARNVTCSLLKKRSRKLGGAAETDEPKMKAPICQGETQDALHGRKRESGGLVLKNKHKKKTPQLDQQQGAVHQQESLTCSPDEPKRKRNRHRDDGQHDNEKSPHLKSSKLSKSAPRTFADAGSGQLHQKANKHSQAHSNPEHEQEDKRLQLLQQFAARGMSGKATETLRERLQGGQFRSLNEFLYTKKGAEALARYRGDPKLFDLVSPADVLLVPAKPSRLRIRPV